MGLFKTKTVVTGIASLLVASASLFAAVVDDEFDDNENNFEYYWYYFDDNAGMGTNDRPQAAPTSQPSVINVPFTEHAREFKGDKSDTYKVKEYTFSYKAEGTNGFGQMPFTYGADFKTPAGWKMQPFAGVGTMLSPDYKSIDLTGTTKIKFKLRSHQNKLSVRFKVQTFEIDSISDGTAAQLEAEDNNPFGYYGINFNVSPGATFQEFEVNIDANGGDLAPPDWADAALPFNLKRVTKLAWEVNKGDNPTVTGDTLDVDAIEVVGYTYKSPRLWTKTVELTPLPTSGKFSDFEGRVPNQNALKKYWYAYTDAAIGGNSSVPTGATMDETTKLLTVSWAAKSGSTGNDTGLQLSYQIGDPVKQGDVLVRGFVGLGCNTYDSLQSKYWNASAAGAKSIYFHYITDGDLPYLTLEISDINEVGDKTNPTRKDSRGSGVVWYKNFPNTSNKWVAVELPLDSLFINSHWKGSNPKPLDLTKIAKVQWKVQGAKGKAGAVAIDNVYFPGVPAEKFVLDGVGILSKPAMVKNVDFNASYANGNINVTVANALTSGTISLFSSNGTRIASQPVGLKTTFSAKSLPAGMYIVKVNAFDVNGKAVSQQSPVTIVK
jgi:hypothetical protein